MRFQGKTALITGGGRGIGATTALMMLAEGATVGVIDLNQEHLNKVTATAQGRGFKLKTILADVTKTDQVRAAVDGFAQESGRLDILVNNAGISPRVGGKKPSVETTPVEHWTRTIAVNLTGTFLVCRAAIPLMKNGGWGRIVNIGSQAGRMNTGFGSAYYSASKAGVIGFSRVLAGEVGVHGITVNCVAPGRIKTAMAESFSNVEDVEKAYIARTPMGRTGNTDDVVAAVAFLVSDAASFITGAIIDVTGGFFMP